MNIIIRFVWLCYDVENILFQQIFITVEFDQSNSVNGIIKNATNVFSFVELIKWYLYSCFHFQIVHVWLFFQVLSWKQSYTPEVFLLGHAQTKVLSTYPNKINLPRTIRTTPPSTPSASDETPPEYYPELSNRHF